MNGINIDTKEGIEELEKKLDGIQLPKVTYHNAPETLEDAVQRLLKVEMLLEDLNRAAEIVEITRQFELFEGFRKAAEEYLTGKVQIEQPDMSDLKLNVIEGEVSTDTKKQLQEQYAKT